MMINQWMEWGTIPMFISVQSSNHPERRRFHQQVYPLVMTNSSPWKDPPCITMLLIGKPSMPMGHLYHGYVSHNQRVNLLALKIGTQQFYGTLNIFKPPKSRLDGCFLYIYTIMRLMLNCATKHGETTAGLE